MRSPFSLTNQICSSCRAREAAFG
ncbi:hypothetical protein PMI28_05536, partial [Pseudomonas sp. GM48]